MPMASFTISFPDFAAFQQIAHTRVKPSSFHWHAHPIAISHRFQSASSLVASLKNAVCMHAQQDLGASSNQLPVKVLGLVTQLFS